MSHGSLDYLHRSTNSCPYPDQPGYISYVCTAVPMFTTDPRARKLISDPHATFDFNPLPILHNSRGLLLFSLCNHACASKEGPELAFRQLMSKMNEESQGIS